jgi:hypothetical protein
MMMEAASASEMSVSFYQTTRSNNTENSHLQDRGLLRPAVFWFKNSILEEHTAFTFRAGYKCMQEDYIGDCKVRQPILQYLFMVAIRYN